MEYLDFNRKNSASVSMPESYILLGEIFFLDIIFDFIENNFKSKKYAVYKAIYIKNLLNFKSLLILLFFSQLHYMNLRKIFLILQLLLFKMRII
jgi:hypothetical protein